MSGPLRTAYLVALARANEAREAWKAASEEVDRAARAMREAGDAFRAAENAFLVAVQDGTET